MSLLGSLLKKANPPTKAEADSLHFGEAAASEKLQIGSKRKNAVEAMKEDSNSSTDFGGKMTKLVANPAQAAYMGPNLWDEVLTFGESSTLEFLNAEDFLFETGILLEKDSKKSSGRNTPTKIVPEPILERPKAIAVHRQPASVGSSSTTSTASSASSASSDASVLRSMLVDGKGNDSKDKSLDTDILQKLLQGCSIPQNTAEVGDSEAEEDEGEEVRESPPLPVIAAEINMSDRELHLATVPGEDVFNPRARRFEHEELRPLPVMRKAKKQFVPEEQKDDKYWERRRKNNVAAKRARDAQRIKMNQIMVRTAWLEKENDKLSAQLAESLAEQQRLKERLRLYEKVE